MSGGSRSVPRILPARPSLRHLKLEAKRRLAAIPPGTLAEQASQIGLRGELVVISQAPLEAQVQLAGLRLFAAADAAPPHRLTGLRGFPLGDRVTDPGPDRREHRLPREAPVSAPSLATRALDLLGSE